MDIKGVTYTWAPQDQSINVSINQPLKIVFLGVN